MKNWKSIILVLWIILLIFPYLIGVFQSDTDLVFGGFLLNPIDGFSYIAKMQQGFHGNWFFQLPYTFEFNGKALLFLFYILLGHISRIFSLNLIFVFHLFRVIFAICLFFTLEKFVTLFFNQKDFFWKITFLTLLFGGGLGWLFFFTGNLPADFWVAESFPFLSSFTNPHFSLTLTLMLWGYIFAASRKTNTNQRILIFPIGFLLSIISPFSALITGFIFLFYFLINKAIDFRSRLVNLSLYFLGSAPMSIYQYIIVKDDPILSLWNDQNITQAPSIGNFIFSFSPFLLGLFLYAILWFRLDRKKLDYQANGLLFWIVFTTILLFLPISLQRRFLVGFYIPIVVLFYVCLSSVIRNYDNLIGLKKRLGVFFFILALPSIFLVYSGSLLAVSERNEKLFYPNSYYKSGEWIDKNIKPGSVFLSTTESGLFIPSVSDVKTVCGHPFETINYQETYALVDRFWNGNMNLLEQKDFLEFTHTDYIFYGINEGDNLSPTVLEEFPLIYQSGLVKIYKVIK